MINAATGSQMTCGAAGCPGAQARAAGVNIDPGDDRRLVPGSKHQWLYNLFEARAQWRIVGGSASNLDIVNAFASVGDCGGVGRFNPSSAACDCPVGALGDRCYTDAGTCNAAGTVSANGACTCEPGVNCAQIQNDSGTEQLLLLASMERAVDKTNRHTPGVIF